MLPAYGSEIAATVGCDLELGCVIGELEPRVSPGPRTATAPFKRSPTEYQSKKESSNLNTEINSREFAGF
jgi:hypothetical protein